jgi:hypothetical protein
MFPTAARGQGIKIKISKNKARMPLALPLRAIFYI